MGLKLKTAAASDPVTASLAKSHMRVDITDDDTLIADYISAATELVQNETGRQFVNATFEYTLDHFPVEDYIELPRSPLSSITSVTYTDADGNTGQTFDSANYTADTYHTPGRLVLKYDKSWPAYREDYNSVVITFVAGYGASGTSTPEAVKQAILMIVGHWYEHRESVSELNLKTVPQAVHNLLATVKLREAV